MRSLPSWLVVLSIAVAGVAVVHAASVGSPRPSARQAQGAGAPRRGGRPRPEAHTARPRPVPAAPLPRMLGQMIIARFPGPSPSAAMLARIRAGEVGGVILFSDNFSRGLPSARAMIGDLQRAARLGGNPPLLVMTDQEGGAVNRVPGPPTLAPSEMSSPALAFAQGRAAGRLLRPLGVNVDLAPVADVERAAGSFLGTRSFGSTPTEVAADACAFARGLASEHVAYTLKHFPGLGRATQSTDVAPVTIGASAADVRADYAAYETCGRGPLAMVMISNAVYPSLTGALPAVMSPLTYARELPSATADASDVTISDDLEAAAITGQAAPARHAINAGLDLLMYAHSEQASAEAYGALRVEAAAGLVSKTRIRVAYDAIVLLKRRVEQTATP